MNAYEQKQQDRLERYQRRAELCDKLSHARADQARKMGEAIPLGQPILIGHHSERRDRNYRDKIQRNWAKASELQKRAEYYRGRAASVGYAGISSDDPEAVTKLLAEIETAESTHARMVEANKLIRRKDTAGLLAIGFSQAQVEKLFQPDFCGRIGFPDYALQNDSANIRRLKLRVEQLRAEHAHRESGAESRYTAGLELPAGVTLEENGDINRIQLRFPGKPAESVRNLLKRYGFRWSPRESAWQRQLNDNGRYAVKSVIEEIGKAAK